MAPLGCKDRLVNEAPPGLEALQATTETQVHAVLRAHPARLVLTALMAHPVLTALMARPVWPVLRVPLEPTVQPARMALPVQQVLMV